MIIMISYLEEYVVPEVIAFYIASSFYKNDMWEATFKQHFNFAFDMNLISFCPNWVHIIVNKGANVQVVAKYLGHTKVEETLKTYSHLFTNTWEEGIAVIDNLDNYKTDDN